MPEKLTDRTALDPLFATGWQDVDGRDAIATIVVLIHLYADRRQTLSRMLHARAPAARGDSRGVGRSSCSFLRSRTQRAHARRSPHKRLALLRI